LRRGEGPHPRPTFCGFDVRAMTRRDEVWEMKRQRFVARQNGGGNHTANHSAGHAGRPRPIQAAGETSHSMAVMPPTSPLSQLVKGGMSPLSNQNQRDTSSQPFGNRAYSTGSFQMGAPSHRSHSQPPLGKDGFDGAVAQQWSKNVQSNVEKHQQTSDPNYAGKFRKPTGYKVTHAPGGGSSISLSWGGGGEADAHGGAGPSRMPSRGGSLGPRDPPAEVGSQRRAASPFCGAAAGAAAGRGVPQTGQRAPSPGVARRAPSPAPYGQQSYASYVADSAYDSRGGGGPPPLPRPPVAPSTQNAVNDYGQGMGFGQKGDSRSSNSYASGNNQNVGNFVCDRRTTRVNRPPGGASNVIFG